MKKSFISLIILFLSCSILTAQFKLTKGSAAVLKNQEKVYIKFTYPDVIVNKKSEQEFLENKMKRNENAAELWHNAKDAYRLAMMETLNKKLEKEGIVFSDQPEGCEYMLVIETTKIGTGIGGKTVPGNVNGEAYIVKISDEKKKLAVYSMKSLRSDLEKTSVSINGFDVTVFGDTDYYERLSKCYSIGGKRLGNRISKELK
jgi:hypothetical protein